MVFDCTGTKRAVLSGLNTHLNRDFFIATEIGKNLFRFHCVTYVTLPVKMVERAENPIHWAKQVTKLREEYGWPCYGIPNLSINYVQLTDGNYKYFFYYEISSTLIKGNRERQIAWLYDLLLFQFECPDSELTDLVIDCHECFEVNPLMVKEKFYYGDCNTPAVLACGDAGIEPDYRLEFGIQSGMNRVDCLVKAIKFNKDTEQAIFHFEQYAQLVDDYIVAHQHEMEQFYSARKESINRWLIVFTEKINLLIDNVDQPEDAILLATCSKEIGEEFFKKNRYHEAINCYSISLKFYTQYNNNLTEEPAFIKCNALIKALQGINCYNDRFEYTCNLIEELKRNFEYLKLNLGNNTNQLEALL